MTVKKKLQVFVSSTYTDLTEERQAAVEAILKAGHIPAGMELFTAGDQSQMTVIKRWIDESDVYMLILGGRYGSIEPESQKSYTHLEYEYALAQSKALFSVVTQEAALNEKVKKHGLSVAETERPQQLKQFREEVTKHMVSFWNDPRDIKLAIHETLNEFNEREDLIGWVRGNELVNTGALAEEMARLAKENAELRTKTSNQPLMLFSGLTFDELFGLLNVSLSGLSLLPKEQAEELVRIRDDFGDHDFSRLHYFIIAATSVTVEDGYFFFNGVSEDATPFFSLGLIKTGVQNYDSSVGRAYQETVYLLTESGQTFFNKLIHLREERRKVRFSF